MGIKIKPKPRKYDKEGNYIPQSQREMEEITPQVRKDKIRDKYNLKRGGKIRNMFKEQYD
jgi:hypothetical protein